LIDFSQWMQIKGCGCKAGGMGAKQTFTLRLIIYVRSNWNQSCKRSGRLPFFIVHLRSI
jgi:hypothetical protein